MPVAEGDCAVIAAAEDINAAAILLCAINVVREIIVNGHVIELRRWLVIPTAPCLARVHAYTGALVTAKNHSLGIVRIDPESVIVVASGRTLDGDESFSRVGRAIDRNVWYINRVRIFGIDINFAKIPEPAKTWIGAGTHPALAAVI